MTVLFPILGNASPLIVLAAFAALLLLVGVALLHRQRRLWISHIRRKALLTPNEAEFFRRLRRALPAYTVFPQISFGALITDDGSLSKKAQWALRSRFDRKIADFVVCDRRTLKVIALIELDDRTHIASNDRQRDAITKAAGYQTFRFESKRKPTEEEIAALLQHADAWIAA